MKVGYIRSEHKLIKNGYYYPVEMYRDLKHRNIETGAVEGVAQVGICFGNRTGGKTVGHAIQMIDNFNNRGETFMLLAKTDKQKSKGYLHKWWSGKIFSVEDADGKIEEFGNRDISFTNDVMYVDGEPMCYCEAISLSHLIKDEGAYKKCSTIILDEAVQLGDSVFMQSNGRPMMVRIFEIWQTVARGWKDAVNLTNLVFIANVSNKDNWVCRDLGVGKFVRGDTKRTVQQGICYEMVMNKSAAKAVADSTMGLIMKNSEVGRVYYESAQNNMFSDNTAFVKVMKLDFGQLIVQLVLGENVIGAFNTGTGVHISKINKDNRSRKICNDVSYHAEDIDYEDYGDTQQALMKCYESGEMTFQTLESKNIFLAYCGYVN